MITKISAPKGTKDIYYPEVEKWHYLEDQIRDFFFSISLQRDTNAHI